MFEKIMQLVEDLTSAEPGERGFSDHDLRVASAALLVHVAEIDGVFSESSAAPCRRPRRSNGSTSTRTRPTSCSRRARGESHRERCTSIVSILGARGTPGEPARATPHGLKR